MCDFHFAERALERETARRELKEPPTERRERVRISLDHFDRAGSPLCAYYVFIMAAYQESRDKTTGALRTPPFAAPRDSLWRPFHITFGNPGPRVGGSLIDTVILAPPVLVVRSLLTIRANPIDFDRCRR